MRRATNVLLSIIALALVVIAVKPTPKAEAQPQLAIAPSSVVHTFMLTNKVYRVWSDGLVEWRAINATCGSTRDDPPGWRTPEWAELTECP